MFVTHVCKTKLFVLNNLFHHLRNIYLLEKFGFPVSIYFLNDETNYLIEITWFYLIFQILQLPVTRENVET